MPEMPPLPTAASLLPTLAALGIRLPPGPVIVDRFGDSAELSEALIALIVAGPKRAGTGLVWAFEAEAQPIPAVGSIEITVDHLNAPALVTRNTRVEVVPFDQVSAEYAAIEGEGDGSLAYWREAHWAFFSRECARIGRVPTPDMPVVCCVFELLNVVPRSGDR
jgi:uncharacterized protein YhfF